MARTTWMTVSVLLSLGVAAATFEVPPNESAATSLSADLQSGADFHVREPVESDGLMHHYVIDSKFGEFPAYGHDAMKARAREMGALTRLSKSNYVDVVTKTVKQSVTNQVDTVGKVVTNPVGTIAGIPKGISHLFTGYKAQANEALDSVKKSTSSQAGGASNSGSSHLVHSAKSNATHYADRYLGISAAERHYYQELGVDPYTNNQVLRKAVERVAKVQAAVNLGMHFVGVPGIPYLSDVQRAMDAIYNEDPAVLRARQRKVLEGYGLSAQEVAQYENTLLLSPTRQAVLAENAKLLDGVAGRDELFRHAMSLTSDAEVSVFIESTRLLARLQARQPLKRILPGLRLPVAEAVDGKIVVVGAFDAVYWTEQVSEYESELHGLLPKNPLGLDMWLSGDISTAARDAFMASGWVVHDHAWDVLIDPPAPKN